MIFKPTKLSTLLLGIICLIFTSNFTAKAQCAAEAGNFDVERYLVCEDKGARVSTSNFNTSADYTQVYYLTAPDRTVVAVSDNGNFPILPSGEYRVNPVNYDNNNPPTLPQVGDSFNDLISQVNSACFALVEDSVGVKVLDPINITSEAFCDDSVSGSYFVRIFVTGGFPSFGNGGSYNINFPPSFAVWDADLNAGTAVIGPIPPGATFSIDVINDGGLCSKGGFRIDVPQEACPDVIICDPTPGMMPTGTLYACDGGSVSAQSMGLELDAGEAFVYALHTGSGTAAGDILAVNTTGTFSAGDGDIMTNTEYYISAVVGTDADSDGTPELDSDCIGIAAGTPVVFLDPITVAGSAVCDIANGTFSIVLNISGGLPTYDGSLYNIGGIFNDQVSGSGIIGPLETGQDYSVSVSDAIGCEAETLQGDVVTCKDEPTGCLGNSDPGVMPSGTVFVGGGEAGGSTSEGVSLGDGEVLVYVLHTATDGTGEIIGVNTTGTFDLPAGANTNTIYYVCAIVGPDTDGDGMPDPDRACISNGTPIVFLTPIVVSLKPTCNDESTEFIVEIIINGGLPAYDGTSCYDISGTFQQSNVCGSTSIGPIPTGENYQVIVSDGVTSVSNNGPVTTCKPAPIELLGFSGEATTEANLLKWTTATETNNDFFTMMRSTDGETFQAIGTVEGAGTSLQAQEYEFADKNAPAGTAYYRLDQTDFNGEGSSSDIIKLTRGENSLDFTQIGPTPVQEILHVTFDTDLETATRIDLYNIAGQVIQSQNLRTHAGLNNVSFDFANLQAGIYMVTITNGVNTITTKVVK